jgi:hypothetical protein
MGSGEQPRTPSEPYGMKALLSKPVIRSICASGFALSFLTEGFEVVFVLYCFSAVEDGGLGLPVRYPFALSVRIMLNPQQLGGSNWIHSFGLWYLGNATANLGYAVPPADV